MLKLQLSHFLYCPKKNVEYLFLKLNGLNSLTIIVTMLIHIRSNKNSIFVIKKKRENEKDHKIKT